MNIYIQGDFQIYISVPLAQCPNIIHHFENLTEKAGHWNLNWSQYREKETIFPNEIF